jgi:predicted 3-demethylubiquinone-9 3-methyltransferase (glyoxalase superfamily)
MAATSSTTTTKDATKGIRVRKISPFLWFDDQLEDAMNFYVSTFDNSRVLSVSRDQVGVGGAKGRVFTGSFELAGQEFMALNGGPEFKFNEAISFFVSCETQEQVDALWERLTSGGGEESQCGWLKDKFGLSWQIVPRALGEMLQDEDAEKAKRVMQAMLQMKKIDIAGLKRAYDQR